MKPSFRTVTLTLIAMVAIVGLAAGGLAQEEQAHFDGTLLSVDVTTQTIVVEAENQTRTTFAYDSETEVAGDETVQGLAAEAGTRIRVMYDEPEGDALPMARQISVLEE